MKALTKESFDEMVLLGSGKLLATMKKKTHEIKNHEIETKDLTRKAQMFSLSQGLRLDPLSPFSGGSINGYDYRWHCVIPPVSQETIFSIRRHRFEELSLKNFACTKVAKDKINYIMENNLPFLVAGATGSGKSSLLHALLKAYFYTKRVILLEEYEELPLSSPLWLKLMTTREGIEGNKSFFLDKLFKETLRLRPDHLVLGELRGAELIVFLEVYNSGHQATCSTIHAGTLDELKNRIKIILAKEGLSFENYFYNLSLWVIFIRCVDSQHSIVSVEEMSF